MSYRKRASQLSSTSVSADGLLGDSPSPYCADVGELLADLDVVPVEPAAVDNRVAVRCGDALLREDAGEDQPDDAGNAVCNEARASAI